jgi:hypothetical protein
VSEVKDQARGAIDFWAGLLDAAAAEVRPGECVFL